MTWHPRKLKDALLPILIVNWISGLSIVEYPLGKPKPVISFIYVIILIFGYFYVPIIHGLGVCNFDSTPTAGTYLVNAIWAYDTFAAVSSIITCWYYQKVLMACIQRIELIDETLECLGSKDHWKKVFRLGLLNILVTLTGMCIPFAADFFWFYVRWSVKKSLYCTFRFHTPVILVTIVDLTYEIIVRCIDSSMRNIILLLESALHKNSILENYCNLNRKHHTLITLIMATKFNSETTENTKNLIQFLKQLHLELSKIIWDLNKIFGLQIAMSTVANIILVIMHAYYLYNAILKSVIISTSSWCIIRFIRIISISNVCGKVTDEAQKVKEIIFELNTINENSELKEEIEQFSLQLSQRPLNFLMCGLFSLECKLIGKVLTTAVTYLVCLIQIAPREPLLEHNTTEIFTTAPK